MGCQGLPVNLILGDVNGRFDTIFKRLEKILQSAVTLDFLICTGKFFGKKDVSYAKYISSDYEIPIPIYILAPTSPEEQEFYPKNLNTTTNLKENLIFLGKCGTFITAKGLKIGYLSGKPSNNCNDEFSHSQDDLLPFKRIGQKCEILVDILVSTCCPSNISLLQPVPPSSCVTSDIVMEAVSIVKPWYHFFSTGDIFFEPKPYANKDDYGNIISVTRCIGLASVSSGNRWHYCLLFEMPRTLTDNDTKNLLESPHKTSQAVFGHSRYDVSYEQEEIKKKHKTRPVRKFNTKECWFCVKSETAESHLNIFIEEFVYVALNRGGIIPQHLNIIPVSHVKSSVSLTDEEYSEVERVKEIVRNHFLKSGLEVIFFERNHKSLHALIHCLPVNPKLTTKIKSLFLKKVLELKMKIKFMDNCLQIRREVQPDQSFFYMEYGTREVCFIPIDKDFPLNFAREIFCDETVLNCPERIDWKSCTLSQEEEEEIVQNLKNYLH
uniref:RNA lariat debranching enzyme, putative n=1 Tax=Riptortus pedestris TaxID=329032 RepID=R4WQ14_RIPPE|nr:RNA lariat debranching enzyme, putative [Riptortus pedestris]